MEKYVGKMILIYILFFFKESVLYYKVQGGHTKRESILAILTLFDGLKQLFFIYIHTETLCFSLRFYY